MFLSVDFTRWFTIPSSAAPRRIECRIQTVNESSAYNLYKCFGMVLLAHGTRSLAPAARSDRGRFAQSKIGPDRSLREHARDRSACPDARNLNQRIHRASGDQRQYGGDQNCRRYSDFRLEPIGHRKQDRQVNKIETVGGAP